MPSRPVISEQIARFVALKYPHAPEGMASVALAGAWMDDLHDLTDEEFVLACTAYRRSDAPEDRWWPTPGRIRAFRPAARALAEAPDDAEATYARLWIVHAGLCGSGSWVDGGEHGQKFERRAPERLVIDRSAEGDRREAALWAGINALGGWAALASINEESRPYRRGDFCKAYRDAMKPKDTNVLAFPAPARADVLPGRDLHQLTQRAFGGGGADRDRDGERAAAHAAARNR
jgi:hypothetical protein